MTTSTTMGLSVPATTGTNRYPGIAHQVKVYDPGVPDVDLLIHAQVLDAEQRPSTIAVIPLTGDEAVNLARAILRALGIDPEVIR